MFQQYVRFAGFAVVSLLICQFAIASTLEQGIALYQRESNDEAAAILKQALEEDPSSTRAAYYLGLTYKRLQRYKEAREQLSFAVNNEPKIKEALLELAEVLYQLEDTSEAAKWLDVAESQGIRPAQVAFMKGLVQMKKGEPTAAITSFSKAKELDMAMSQAADYQIGMAHLKQNEFSEASQAFNQVLTLDPNTDIGVYAQEYMKAIESRREASRPWKLKLGIFGEWDDNVVLKPSDVTTVQDVGGDDFREVVTLNAEYSHRFSDRFSLKGSYDLYFANQHDLGQFDVNSHTFGLTPAWTSGAVSLSTPFSYNYTWVNNDDFVATVTGGPALNWRLNDTQLLQATLRFQDKNFLRSPTLPSEDRDAFRWAPGAAWYWFFKDNMGFFGGRYEYDSEDTDGENWDYQGHRATLSLQWPFTTQLKGTLAGEYYWQEFDNTHTVFGVRRDDGTFTLSALLTYSITKQLDVQFRYTFVDHSSNIALYEYDRNVYSSGVTYRF